MGDEIKQFSDLLGKTLKSIESDNDEVRMELEDGRKFRLCHHQDCCESVYVEDVAGDLQDLVGSPLLQAEEVNNADEPQGAKIEYRDRSETWTFYKLATIKGSVTIRFYGSSNGYYSESVDFEPYK